jgi:FtsH-binding integral membrane protein
MENQNSDYTYQNVIQIEDADASRKFLANVFIWMFAAMGISAFTGYAFTATPLVTLIIDPTVHQLTGLGIVALISPIVFSLLIRFGYTRLSFGVLVALFIVYASMMGITLGLICSLYLASSVITMFIASAAIFGVMAIAGYTTKTDLTAFGSILIMIFFGAFIATIINWFMGSAQMDYILSYVFVAVFIGLTAYYVQMLKRIGAGLEYGSADSKKLTIIGALVLYTTFVNLFIRLLMIFGRRR